MFYNDVNCDIYIGKGAGEKLLNDIYNARKSIKIVSPYLSPFLISELINIRKKNLDVELITTDNIKDFPGENEKNTRKLILQNRETDEISVNQREKWKYLIKVLTYIGFGLLVILIGVTYSLRDIQLVFGLIPIMIIYLIIKLFRIKIKQKRIYSYWYSQLFPFKVYKSPYLTEQSDTFIHGKIYLIDDKIAYLGSLNFTTSGTKYNYESRIRTVDLNAVNKIKEEFYQLMNQSQLPEKDIQDWGRKLYSEPIN